jgi:hypothetical protein
MNSTTVDTRWNDLYKIAGGSAIFTIAMMVLGIVLYFVYPYAPGKETTEGVFLLLQKDPIAGLISLDILLFLGNLAAIPVFLGLYCALKPVNASYALLALVFGIVAIVLLIPARPIPELFALSAKFVAEPDEILKNQYLAAGTALLALFDGVNWFMNTLLGAISLLTSSLLMLRSNVFSKTTAIVGIATNVILCGFFLPVVGVFLLFLTLPGYMFWYALLAKRFFQMGRNRGA